MKSLNSQVKSLNLLEGSNKEVYEKDCGGYGGGKEDPEVNIRIGQTILGCRVTTRTIERNRKKHTEYKFKDNDKFKCLKKNTSQIR